jgi:hypothetical protein
LNQKKDEPVQHVDVVQPNARGRRGQRRPPRVAARANNNNESSFDNLGEPEKKLILHLL